MGLSEMAVGHPYNPTSMQLPGFTPAFMTQGFILGSYGGASCLVVLAVWILSGYVQKLSKVDRSLMCWFAFSGLTHIILEGYFVFTPDFYKLTPPNLLAEVWKEFSKGDSRYAGRDATIICLEGITAVLVGPGCLLAVESFCKEYHPSKSLDRYAIAAKTTYEHSLQLVVSISQLYGDIVYFVAPVLVGVENSLPGLMYYWFYYIFMNSIWVVVPLIISSRSWIKIGKALASKKKKTA